MKKYLKVVIGSRGEMDCNIINSNIMILKKKVDLIKKMYEEEGELESIEEFLSIDVSKDEKLICLGLGEEDSEIYIREDFDKYSDLLELWNEDFDSEKFRNLLWDIEVEVYK